MRLLQLCIWLTITCGACLSPHQAAAWGKYGHLVVCDLAYRNLTDASKEELKLLFRAEKGGITVRGRHYTSFNVGCLEEDEFPRPHPDDHFINVPRGATSIDSNTCPGKKSCILAGISRDAEVLGNRNASAENRVDALMALGHWVGDIHQPLHVSFEDDRGGNLKPIVLAGRCGNSKYRAKELHGVWDNCLLEAGLFERVRQRDDFKKSWGERTITYRAVDTLQANTTLSEEQSVVGTDPWVWANESYAITLTPAILYCEKVGGVCQYSSSHVEYPGEENAEKIPLGQDYLNAFERTAEARVRLAGFRLAHIINLALDPSYTVPIQNSTQRP